MKNIKNKIRKFLRKSSIVSSLLLRVIIHMKKSRLRSRLAMLYLKLDGSKVYKKEVLQLLIDETSANYSQNCELTRGMIIKAPQTNKDRIEEKGIIILGFESEIGKLSNHEKLEWLAERYDVLFMPTWQPFYSKEVNLFLKRAKSSLFILPSSENCYYDGVFNHPDINFLPFHASSWVPATRYKPVEKDIDIIMVANFSTYKRHKLLFAALKTLPQTLRVVVAGRELADRKAKDILAEAKLYCVENRFELIESPSDEILIDLVSRARLAVGLSGREGSYVALAEAVVANTPVALFKDAAIGSKNYINPKTGFLIDEDKALGPQLNRALELCQATEPRKWALSNIVSEINVERLSYLMKFHGHNNPIQSFFINGFKIEPTEKVWQPDILTAVEKAKSQGFHFKL